MNARPDICRMFASTIAALVMGIGLGACSPSEKTDKPSPSASPSSAATPKPAATPAPATGDSKAPSTEGMTGTVKIKAVYQGADRPKRIVLNMAGNPDCVQANNGKKIGNANLLVNKDMTTRNVICFLKDTPDGMDFEPPAEKAMLDQQGCMYSPHVQTVMTKQPITVRNSDATLHNIHTFAEKQRATNFAQPSKGDQRDIEFARPEFVKVKCDVHPWMSAYVGVFDHPYHAVTGTDGTCVIELPAGEHTIGGWHEDAGDLEPIKVMITADQEIEVEIKVPE